MLDLITHYYDNPINRRVMEDANVSHHEGNSLCGDDITVYIKLSDDWVIQDRSYDGNLSMVTIAASSFFSELIVGRSLEDVFSITYENTLLAEGFEVTPRRKRAWAIAILATRNALHNYIKDNLIDTRDDVVEM